jgi:HAD superfamily hydrolase (TIGR01549 family)
MLRAILFDMGGTLDGDGVHWLDRFASLYAEADHALPRDVLRAAFDAAERHAAIDEEMLTAGLDAMLSRHVGWQFDALGISDQALQQRIVSGFASAVRRAAEANARLLASLHSRGFTLGVVSNGCGNVRILCDELGYTPYLMAVIDSRHAGVSKPDPAIYQLAIARLGVPASTIMMVGDSFERDIAPARSTGMRTAWLRGEHNSCPDPAQVDLELQRLIDLLPAIDARERRLA